MNKSIEVYCSRVFRAGKSQRHAGSWIRYTAVVLLVLLAAPLSAGEQNNQDEVGRVTLAIGQAVAHNKKGEQRLLKRGDPVYVDETIETSAGGHVHLRFVDEGTVSLRPNSRLSIELYHYDKMQPKNSAIRFNLEAGVVRSISGKATQAAHDRFRLNTPITAIGVLGTDFVVRAEPEKMWAGVYSGAIAISPLGGQCAANGLGACAGATRLSEAMGSVMIEFNGGREREKIVPLDPAVISKASRSGNDSPEKSAESPSTASGRMNAAEIKAADVATHIAVADTSSQSGSVQQPSPFAWARSTLLGYLPGGVLAGDTMSQPLAVAGEGRAGTVGNKYFTLFRAPSALAEIEPRSGTYDFKLTQGQVYFVGNGVSWLPQVNTLARLDAATLQVDFAQRQFNTHLEMSYPQVGSAVVDLSGPVQNNGIFIAQDANSKVGGALSANGAYAGMLFERTVESGTFQGVTDWAKK